MMNDLMSLLAFLVGLALGGLGATWWWLRPLKAAKARVAKLEAAREALKQQNSQARKQLEQLQTEVAELRHALGKIDAARAKELRVQAASRSLPDQGPFLGEAQPASAASDGFAQTQVFLPRSG
jgi:cell division protein FtsB